MPHPQSTAAHARRAMPPIVRRRLVLALLFAVGFVSGVGASSRDDGDAHADPATSGEGEVVASFDAIPIDALPLHDGATLEVPASIGEDVYEPDAGLMVVTRGEIGRGQSLASVMQGEGVSPAMVHLINQKVRPIYDFRNAKAGHRFRLALDSDGNLIDFRYSTSLEESIYLFWDGEGYVIREEIAELSPRTARLAGVIETSLYEAIRGLGEDPQLASDFAEIFAWDIDFTRNVQAGDDFRVVYERLFLLDDDGEEVYVRPGRILAARYNGGGGEHTALYFEPEEGRGSYYRPDGSSVERQFLVAPLQYSRISSHYTTARRHPILNVTRRHPGIDYAAAEGTQLYAVSDGRVIFRGWAGASGNLVKIQHLNGYVSHYAHLSRFADDLKVGQRVTQKQVIGYVGHTGLATGSHVCFRVTKNGRYVNPLKIQSPAGEPVGPELRQAFQLVASSLVADLEMRTQLASDEAL